MSFENFPYVRVSPIPRLIYTNQALNYPICSGPQALIRVLFKTKIFIENWEGCKLIKKMITYYFKKMRFQF